MSSFWEFIGRNAWRPSFRWVILALDESNRSCWISLKTEVSVPGNEKISTIHLATAKAVTNLWGLIKLSKSCPSFFFFFSGLSALLLDTYVLTYVKVLIRKLHQLNCWYKFTLSYNFCNFWKVKMSNALGVLLKNLRLKNISCVL